MEVLVAEAVPQVLAHLCQVMFAQILLVVHRMDIWEGENVVLLQMLLIKFVLVVIDILVIVVNYLVIHLVEGRVIKTNEKYS